MERVRGIEPPSRAWEAHALPLSYTRRTTWWTESGWPADLLQAPNRPQPGPWAGRQRGESDLGRKSLAILALRPRYIVGMTLFRRLLDEPLLHCALIGLGLFLIDGLRAGDPAPAVDGITFTSADLVEIEAQDSPLPLEQRVSDRIAEERAAREALRLGLDQGDAVIRGRLADKLDNLTMDVAALAEPDDQDLVDLHQREAERWSNQGTIRPLAEVHDDVLARWRVLHREDARRALDERLRRDYPVTWESADLARRFGEAVP